jgi:hypothetical protein
MAYSAADRGAFWIEIPDVGTFHLAAGSGSVTAFVGETVAPESILDAFYGSALPLVVQAARGFEILHGSAVVVSGTSSVAAFCGSSGAGKSTVAYGLSRRGHTQWADDAVAFRVGLGGEITAAWLPYEVKLRPASSAFFGSANGAGGAPLADGHRPATARLAAVYLLERVDAGHGDEPVSVSRLDSADALHALLPNAFRLQPQSPARRRETIASYLELAAAVPVARARYPDDLLRLPELLDALETSFASLA